MTAVLRNPFFFVGLVPKLVVILFFAPTLVTRYYGPFMEHSLSSMSINPWQSWLEIGGSSEAFPYGYVMWLVFLPGTFISQLSGIPIHAMFGLTLLLVDIALLGLLSRFSKIQTRSLVIAYWWSPVIFLSSYLSGSTDLVPISLLLVSILLLRANRFAASGTLIVLAASAKVSMLLALPFVIIYFVRNKSIRRHFKKYSLGFLIAAIVMLMPQWLFSSGVSLILSNPELRRLLMLSLPAGEFFSVYLVPLVFAVSLYASWRVKRMSFELFLATTGLAFMLVVVLSPSSPGWYVWVVPFLVLFLIPADRLGFVLYFLFSIAYVMAYFFGAFGNQPVSLLNGEADNAMLSSIGWTMLVSLTLIIAYRTMRERVIQNDYFRLSRRPIVLGVAGDSGSGKDTLAENLIALFGPQSVVHVSGDDYHRWDRHRPMWQAFTHLNPSANDLEGFTRDVLALASEQSVLSRHYDHSSGKMSRLEAKKSNDIVIASGLHALYLPPLRETYTLSIFLDMDEELRRYLKITRDTVTRGHSLEAVVKSIDARIADGNKYIQPQSQYADLTLSLLPVAPLNEKGATNNQTLNLALRARFRSGVNDARLSQILVGLTALRVDTNRNYETGDIEMFFSGDCLREDIELATKLLVPRLMEFLDTEPNWKPGVAGIMQLLVLVQLDEALTRAK